MDKIKCLELWSTSKIDTGCQSQLKACWYKSALFYFVCLRDNEYPANWHVDICIWSKFRQDCFVLDISSTGCRLIVVTAVSCAWTNPLSCLYCFSSFRWLAPSRWSRLTVRAVEVVVLFFFFSLDVALVWMYMNFTLFTFLPAEKTNKTGQRWLCFECCNLTWDPGVLISPPGF